MFSDNATCIFNVSISAVLLVEFVTLFSSKVTHLIDSRSACFFSFRYLFIAKHFVQLSLQSTGVPRKVSDLGTKRLLFALKANKRIEV